MRGSGTRCRWLAASGAGVLALGALIAALAWPAIFDRVLAAQIALTPGSRSYREWLEPSVPLNFDVYLFNWTNAGRFPDEKPHLDQLGPYRFVETRRHVNVTWNPRNDSVSYRTFRSWAFDRRASNASLDDNVTTLNPIAASAVYRAREWDYLRQKGLSLVGFTMNNHHLTVSKTARELLFEGYEDSLLDMAKNLPASATGGAPPVDRFGWFYGRNNSLDTDGFMEVSTGSTRGTTPGQILRWNFEDHLPFYTEECSKLKGSVGEFMPRDLTEDSRLTMFVADLCRTVHMEYAGSGQLQGLQYHTYALNERSFDNSTISHNNTCFCNGQCAWGGVMNVSACRFGSPAFISLPHFLHADPALADMVTGLRPDPDLHSFYFSVEPKLGVPLDVAARFQLNFYIEPNPHIALYQNVPRMMFPLFWVEQRVGIGEKVLSELASVRTILDWGGVFCASVAVLLTACALLVTCGGVCFKKPKYVNPNDIMYEKPKDEAATRLNPM